MAYRDCILEVYARRFYRIRDLHGLDHEGEDIRVEVLAADGD